MDSSRSSLVSLRTATLVATIAVALAVPVATLALCALCAATWLLTKRLAVMREKMKTSASALLNCFDIIDLSLL